MTLCEFIHLKNNPAYRTTLLLYLKNTLSNGKFDLTHR